MRKSFKPKSFFKSVPESEQKISEIPSPPPMPESPIVSGCNHSLGYLNKRAKGEEIPSECIVCGQSIECLLGSLKIHD